MSNSIAKDFRFFSLLRFALPTIIMMVFMSLYTIVDGIFVSRLLGSDALSALNIVYPFISLTIACGVMIASGGSALCAKKMGEGKDREARELFSMLLLTAAVIGLLLLAVGTVFLRPLVRLLGATDLLMADSMTYLQVSLYFAPACVLQLFFQTFFVTAGNPGLGLALTVTGGLCNMIFDYLFMGPLRFGIAGAALATGIGQLIPTVVGIFYFLFVRRTLYIVRPRLRLRDLAQSCLNGFSEMVTNISNAVITYLFNIVMLRLLGEDGVAAITIVLYGQFLFNALYMGFSMGVAPIISFNHGRRNTLRLKRILKLCFQFIVGTSVMVTLTALLASPAIVGVFTPPSTNTYAITKHGFFLFSFNYLFAGINIFASAMFTAFNNGPVSALISFLRTFVFIAASILLLPQFLGVTGVWLSVPAAELLTLFLSLYLIRTRGSAYLAAPPEIQ